MSTIMTTTSGSTARALRCRRAGESTAERSGNNMDLTAIVTWIIFGAIVGVIARFLMPGRDPMGPFATIVLGIVGSFVGGFLAQVVFAGNTPWPPPTSGWIGSIIGAFVVLAIYRYSQGRRVVA
jgi:uncharacterized membrane protein YeaQ/YmgE (transglycosylase-associated protein family)